MRSILRPVVAWLAVALVLPAAPVFAQEPAPAAEAPAAEAPAPAAPAGEAPGSAAPAEKPPADPPANMGGYSWTDPPRRKAAGKRKKRDPNTPVAAFPAFHVLKNGTTRIVVRVSKKVQVVQRKVGSRTAFVLVGAEVASRNGTLGLPTTHFATPLSRLRLVPHRDGAQLVLEFRQAAEPTMKTVDGPRGSTLLVIELPPLAVAPEGEAAVAEPTLEPPAPARASRELGPLLEPPPPGAKPAKGKQQPQP